MQAWRTEQHTPPLAARASRPPHPTPPHSPPPRRRPPRSYRHFGTFAYVGMDRAVLSLPSAFPFNALQGWLVGLTWRGFETWGQVRLPGKRRQVQEKGGGHAKRACGGSRRAVGGAEGWSRGGRQPDLGVPPGPRLQVSARNRWMVQSDWVRMKLFGRNITEV